MSTDPRTPDEVRLAWQAVEAAALRAKVQTIEVARNPLALRLTVTEDLSGDERGRLRGYLHAVFGPTIPHVKFFQSEEPGSGDWWQKKGR